ncbi:MAG: hypothetical protein NC095_11580 [Muribaculum sp.]|nr:hypothetical protein [Muribaculum sp.]
MNTNIKYISLLSPLLLMAACSDDYTPGGDMTPSLSPHYLSVSKTSFQHSAAAFSESFEVKSDQTAWKFSGVADWIALAPASGSSSSSVAMEVGENKSADNARTAIFYLQSADAGWSFNRALSVSQEKAEKRVAVHDTVLSFAAASGQREVSVSANCEWTASASEEWISVSANASIGTLTVSVTPNTTDSHRDGVVTIDYGGPGKIAISVNQAVADVSASSYTLEYENVASSQTIIVNSDVAWHSETQDSWIQVAPTEGGAGSTTVAIEVAPNSSVAERTGYVYIKTGHTERIQLIIKQKGIYIEADPSIEFGPAASQKKLNISSNTDWVIESVPDWVQLSEHSGSGSKEITVSVAENPNTTQRSGNIVIGQSGLDIRASVEVIQRGISFSADTSVLEFGDKGGSQSFNIFSDSSWTSSVNATWFAATPESGVGDSRIDVTAEENTSSEERVGVIEYRYADKTTNVNVHQLAKYLSIENKSFSFESAGGSHIVYLATNDKWTARVEGNPSWLTLSDASGTGDAEITITAADNPSVRPRSAEVVIETENSQSVIIKIYQEARSLSVSTKEILFYAKGGTSDAVKVVANGAYEIQYDSSWFSVNSGADNTFTVYAAANPYADTRRGKISIVMKDITDGELSVDIQVIQAGEGGSFILDGYPSDSNWSDVGAGTLTITIHGYGPDSDWNGNGSSSDSFDRSPYPSDSNWNSND